VGKEGRPEDADSKNEKILLALWALFYAHPANSPQHTPLTNPTQPTNQEPKNQSQSQGINSPVNTTLTHLPCAILHVHLNTYRKDIYIYMDLGG